MNNFRFYRLLWTLIFFSSLFFQAVQPIPVQASPAESWVDNTDTGLVYQGEWVQQSGVALAYQNTQAVSNKVGDTITYSFTGPRLTLLYAKLRKGGILDVSIDGILYTRITQSSGRAVYQQQWSVSGLSDGQHTLLLRHSRRGVVNLDGIMVLPAPVTVTSAGGLDDADTIFLAYKGYWQPAAGLSQTSNGTQTISSKIGDKVQLQFSGNRITVIYAKIRSAGWMGVYIDGIFQAYIKQHNGRQAYQQQWRSKTLSEGLHTLELRHSRGGPVNLDAVIISQPPTPGSCTVFPSNNIWNTPIDTLPVHSRSNAYVNSIGASTGLHPDFGSGTWNGGPIGIPYVMVGLDQPYVPINFTAYGDESDPGPYPVPPDAPIEGGPNAKGDRHVLVWETGLCKLYELYRAFPQRNGSWNADSGAVYDLKSNQLRPDKWTSADAAGLPIFAGLVRYDEVAAGEIRHAIRFTVPETQRAYLWPARHYASSSTNPDLPPMGLRFRLKSTFDISGFSPEMQVILKALKTYGMIVADNGSSWYLSGAPDPRWNNDDLVTSFRRIRGSDFEAVDESSLMISSDSGEARQP
jgi:hypothetical protein